MAWRLLPPELTDTKTARPFSFSFNTSDYRILLMDQDQGRLYLGSREYLVALDMHNVNKEPLIVGRTARSFLKSGLLSPPDPKLCLKPQIHWPASAKRKGECQMTGKGRQVGAVVYILLFLNLSPPRTAQ